METKPILGMYAGFGFHVSFEERVGLIADAGFDCTSLWWEHKNEEIRRLKHFAPSIARDAGLGIESIHVPYSHCNDFWCGDEAQERNVLALHCAWLDDCNRYEIPIMVMHVTLGKAPPGVSDRGVGVYEELVRYAERQGVVVAIENTRSDVHLDALFAGIDSKYLGLCYDVSHDVLYSGEPGRLLRMNGDRLVSTHLADTDGILDRHWLPGSGTIKYEEVMKAFPRWYRGAFVLEVSSGRIKSSLSEFVSDAYDSLQVHLLPVVLGN